MAEEFDVPPVGVGDSLWIGEREVEWVARQMHADVSACIQLAQEVSLLKEIMNGSTGSVRSEFDGFPLTLHLNPPCGFE